MKRVLKKPAPAKRRKAAESRELAAGRRAIENSLLKLKSLEAHHSLLREIICKETEAVVAQIASSRDVLAALRAEIAAAKNEKFAWAAIDTDWAAIDPGYKFSG